MDLIIQITFLWLNLFSSALAAFEFEFVNFTPLAEHDPNYLDYGTLRVAKKGRNHFVVLGNFTLKTNFGREVTTRIDITNDQKIKIFSATGNICDVFATEKKIIPEVRRHSNLPEAGTCPLPKGEYWLGPYQVPVEKATIVPPGNYEFRLLISISGRIIGGLTTKVCLSNKKETE